MLDDDEIDFGEIRSEIKSGDRWTRAAYGHGFMHGALAVVVGALVLTVISAAFSAMKAQAAVPATPQQKLPAARGRLYRVGTSA